MHKVIYHDDPEKFRSKVIEVDGEPMICTPAHYKRVTPNENGGLTIEYSLTPFPGNETAKESNPR